MSRNGLEQRKAGKPHRFLALGEIMLRLTPPDYGLLGTADRLEAHYGGSEANIAVELAGLGVDSSFFTVVPDNSLGKSAVRTLQSRGVSCDPVIFSTPEQTPTHRLGVYYLESGYGIRSSRVVYDRKHSAITEFDFSSCNPELLLDGYTWLHVSGITPALGENCRQLVLDCLRTAKEKGLTVSFDGNFRSALWSWEEARDFCTRCLPYVDVLFGIEPYHLWRDEEDHSRGDVKDGVPLQPDREEQDRIFRVFAERYPNLKGIARHVRYAHSGGQNSLKAYLWLDGRTFESGKVTFDILDRVGAGDAFAAGFLYAWMQGCEPEQMLDFAVASSAFKHTIRGDANLPDGPEVLWELVRRKQDTDFDIKR